MSAPGGLSKIWRSVFAGSGPRREEASSLHEQVIAAGSAHVEAVDRNRQAVRALLDETLTRVAPQRPNHARR